MGGTTVAGLAPAELANFVARVLAEDLGEGGDVTTDAIIPASARLSARMAARDGGVVAGLDLAAAFFRALDHRVEIDMLAADGDRVPPGAALMHLSGLARPMLSAERSALNTLQHLTGIATSTRDYVDALAGTGCILLDTRKTHPGLRVIEKYAARIGGARNHRMRLDDGVLIKDNHISVAGEVEGAVHRAKAGSHGLPVQVEVDRLDQIEPALRAGADSLLCDNMSPEMLLRAVEMVGGRVPIEASGGVRLDTIRAIAETGVTFVSVGRITQSAGAADIGLDYAEE